MERRSGSGGAERVVAADAATRPDHADPSARDASEPGSGSEQAPSPERSRGGPGPRARLVIAILIAATGVLSSVATWRSDVSDRERRDSLRAADYQDRERQGAVEEIDSNLNDSRITLVRVRVDDRRAKALAAQARASGIGAQARRRASALAAGYGAMAAVVRERIDPDVLAGGATPAAFGRARRLQLATAAARRDLDPKPELAQADEADTRSDKLRVLGVAALIAALLLTCAEVSSSRWHRLFLAVGVVALAVTMGLLIDVGFIA
jgi:hypothetical protein